MTHPECALSFTRAYDMNCKTFFSSYKIKTQVPMESGYMPPRLSLSN
jgi:hypothetical protein